MAASGTSMDLDLLERNVPIEAYNLTTAIMDSDTRLSDDELWPLIATFSRLDMLPPSTTPEVVRRERALAGHQKWLQEPSEMFTILARVDQMRGTQLAQTYYDEAMKLAHMVGSLDRFPSDAELRAIVGFQKLLRDNLPSAHATAAAVGGPAASAEAAAGEERREPEPKEPLDDVLAELDRLIGLDAVKEEVRLLSAMLRVQKMRADRDLPVIESTKHLVFSGNPGTGKTTVARIVGKIFGAIGILEKGHVVETDRSGLVAEYAGQTGPKANKKIDEAKDGVLFIDEAYSLIAAEGEDPFGNEAVQALLKRMEDDRDQLVVILAGYPHEMRTLLGSNPGLSSRFSRHLHFVDYAPRTLPHLSEDVHSE